MMVIFKMVMTYKMVVISNLMTSPHTPFSSRMPPGSRFASLMLVGHGPTAWGNACSLPRFHCHTLSIAKIGAELECLSSSASLNVGAIRWTQYFSRYIVVWFEPFVVAGLVGWPHTIIDQIQPQATATRISEAMAFHYTLDKCFNHIDHYRIMFPFPKPWRPTSQFPSGANFRWNSYELGGAYP